MGKAAATQLETSVSNSPPQYCFTNCAPPGLSGPTEHSYTARRGRCGRGTTRAARHLETDPIDAPHIFRQGRARVAADAVGPRSGSGLGDGCDSPVFPRGVHNSYERHGSDSAGHALSDDVPVVWAGRVRLGRGKPSGFIPRRGTRDLRRLPASISRCVCSIMSSTKATVFSWRSTSPPYAGI